MFNRMDKAVAAAEAFSSGTTLPYFPLPRGVVAVVLY